MKMNEKRFKLDFDNHSQGSIMDRQDKYGQYCRLYDFGEVGRQQIVDLLNELSEENEQLRKIGVMYQGHNPCSNCTYCVEDKVCCGIYPPIFCDEMKKDYFVYGLCKKHKQIQKSNRRYNDE